VEVVVLDRVGEPERSERRDVLLDGLRQAGWEIPTPDASMFAWAPVPQQYRHMGSLEFSKLLLERANVAVAPGVGFGEYGEGFVRIALVENRHRLRQAARNIKHFLSGRNTPLEGVQQPARAVAAPPRA
jgi:alanine-synthesizing transaminase